MGKNVHRFCDPCWGRKNPEREPVRVKDDPGGRCCSCGAPTTSGIYVLDRGTFDFCEGNHKEKPSGGVPFIGFSDEALGFCKGNHESKTSGGVPFIGFSNDTLEKLPPAKEGDTIQCKHCGEPHILQAAKGGPGTLFYTCGGEAYLGGIRGKLVAFQEPDISG